MALIDLYRRYMYGNAPQDMGFAGGERLTGGTQGLFGQGNEAGGGLLNTFNKPNTDGLFNALSNPYLTIGASAVNQGLQGKDIGQSLMPSIKQGLSLSETSKKIQSAKKKQDLIKKYSKEIPKEDMEIFLISPENYIQAKLKSRLSTPTLSKEALAVVQKLKGLSESEFNVAFPKLSQVEKDLYKSYVKKPSGFDIPSIVGAKTKSDTAAAENARVLPTKIKDGVKLVDVDQLDNGLIYNVGGQAERWNEEKGKFEKVK